MSTMKRRFDIVAGRPYSSRDGEEKKAWINVGRMTEWDDGGFSIELNAVPVGSWFDGRLSVFEQKPKEGEQRQERSRPQRSQQSDIADDSIPF